MKMLLIIILIAGLYASCNKAKVPPSEEQNLQPFIVVLGIAQDAGYPQANCQKSCCADAWVNTEKRKMVSCLGIVDPVSNSCWMIDATPDFKDQLYHLRTQNNRLYDFKGVLLTHAHVGHYTGLMNLGREVMGTDQVPVYAMPGMASFLTQNGPWSQLVALNNIQIKRLQPDSIVALNPLISIMPILVPHRDEFSETVGYSVQGENRRLLFIPDIDKWSLWNRDLKKEIDRHDYVLIDGSFYANGEIPNRDMSEIPHPFITETMQLLEDLTDLAKAKVHFIHFNHTNPILNVLSPERQEVIRNGYQICQEGGRFVL